MERERERRKVGGCELPAQEVERTGPEDDDLETRHGRRRRARQMQSPCKHPRVLETLFYASARACIKGTGPDDKFIHFIHSFIHSSFTFTCDRCTLVKSSSSNSLLSSILHFYSLA
jgi:hypothetical protein